jgi:putative ABC transport system permease protein
MSRTARLLLDSARSLGANRVRTCFMVLGTFVGVAALIVMVAMGRGTQNEVLERLERMLSGSTILLRAGGVQARGSLHSATGPTTTLTLRDLATIDSEMASVEAVDPLVMASREVVYDGRSASITIEGHAETADIAWNRSASRGAFLTAADVASAERVALVGETVVEELFDGSDPIGARIRIGNVPFNVIGVLEPGGIDPHGIDRDNVIMIPISTMMRRVANVDWISNAKFVLTPGTDLDMAVLEIGDILRRLHAIGPDDPDDFTMYTPLQVQSAVGESNRVFTLFLPLIASISILVGGIVVANLMFLTVNERRAEIGLRKAVGAREGDLRLQFLAESAAVTGLGGLLAGGVAFVAITFFAMHGRPAAMPWTVALAGIGVSVLVGIVAGVAPARRAAALDPVRTLR